MCFFFSTKKKRSTRPRFIVGTTIPPQVSFIVEPGTLSPGSIVIKAYINRSLGEYSIGWKGFPKSRSRWIPSIVFAGQTSINPKACLIYQEKLAERWHCWMNSKSVNHMKVFFVTVITIWIDFFRFVGGLRHLSHRFRFRCRFSRDPFSLTCFTPSKEREAPLRMCVIQSSCDGRVAPKHLRLLGRRPSCVTTFSSQSSGVVDAFLPTFLMPRCNANHPKTLTSNLM